MTSKGSSKTFPMTCFPSGSRQHGTASPFQQICAVYQIQGHAFCTPPLARRTPLRLEGLPVVLPEPVVVREVAPPLLEVPDARDDELGVVGTAILSEAVEVCNLVLVCFITIIPTWKYGFLRRLSFRQRIASRRFSMIFAGGWPPDL